VTNSTCITSVTMERSSLRWEGSHRAPRQKLLPKPADILPLIEDVPDVTPVAKSKNATRRKQMKSSAHDEEYSGRQQGEEVDWDQDVVQPDNMFASLQEQ
jgi:hypothetical protein